MSHKSLTW